MRKAFHRYVWQSLPQSLRRAVLFGTTALAAQRPTQGAKPKAPIIVAGGLRTASGLGESARLCYEALNAADLPVFGIDLTSGLVQPLDLPDYGFADGRLIGGEATLILHVNSPLVPLALCRLGPRFVKDKYIIGVWVWELPAVPRDWYYGVPFVHEIWVPSAFSADAIRPIAGGRPIREIPYPVAMREISMVPRTRRPDRPFTALLIFNMASSFARKNPLAAITAFQKAFGNDLSSRLIVKISNGAGYPNGMSQITRTIGRASNIVLIDKVATFDELQSLYGESDVVISLHRSEGFGLTLAEAMLHRLPVIATNWSGSIDFLHPDFGLPIPYRLVPAEDPQRTYHQPDMVWAEADVDAAAAALRRLRQEPDFARQLGEAGGAYAARTWSAETYATRVRHHLNM